MTNKTAQASTCLNHLTSEYARPGHPDKLADQVSDAVLDAHLGLDPLSRVAVECLLKGNTCTLAGEITSRAVIDLPAVVSSVLGAGMTVTSHITQQDRQIGGAVDHGGTGDMGHNPGTDLAKWCQHLNTINWFARGFGCDGRLSFSVGTLKETRISGNPEQQNRAIGHSIPLERKQ